MLAAHELKELKQACRRLPKGRDFREYQYVTILLNTVLDFRMQPSALKNAREHFMAEQGEKVTTHAALRRLLAKYPDGKAGCLRAANDLFGKRHWLRVDLLKRLTEFLDRQGVTERRSLKAWARRAEFARDVHGAALLKGKKSNGRNVHLGVGIAIFKWLQLRLGLESVKPEVGVLRFVERVVARKVREQEAAAALEQIARQIGVPARLLDAAIWEHGRE
jgi:hypothetical protein